MMQVQEVSNKGLKHEFKITVPSADLDSKMVAHLEKIAKTANIQGFRPGKAPLALIKQRYGAQTRGEVLDEVIQTSTQTALSERKLRPALQPKVDIVEIAEGKDLEFTVAVEVLPEIKLGDFTKLSLERPVVEVADAKVEEALTRISKEVVEPELVTEPRATVMGDTVVIDFDGSVDGERQPGMKAEKHSLVLGSKSFIDTFEEQLVGLKVGASKDVTVTFPADYHAANLAGKKAVFAITLHEIRAAKDVAIDDALAKKIGFDSLEALRKRVHDDLSSTYAQGARGIVKRKLLDLLAEQNTFEVPGGLLDMEFESIWAQVQQSKKRGELPEEDKGKSDDELRAEYRTIAERRIRLGLVLAEVGEQQKIKISNDELRDALMAEVRRYPGQEQAVFNYFTKTEGAMERLRAPVLEEKTIDYILSQAKVTDKKVTIDELVKMQEEAEAA